MLIVSLWGHSSSLPCSSLNDVKTQLPQHCQGRELKDTETALGIQAASFGCEHACWLVFSCQTQNLTKLSCYSSSFVPWLLKLWERFNLNFISSSISLIFYIRNLVSHSKFVVTKNREGAVFNHILLSQTISFTLAIILVKLIYYSNYSQFQVCY